VSNFAGYFRVYFVSDTFESKSRCLLEVCNVLLALMDNITFHGASKLNYDTVKDLDIEVASQMERAAQVTHGELKFPENLTKIFPNSEIVKC
jgi:hypothetical protein